MLLNDQGNVMSWGDNDTGQLGHGVGEKEDTPKIIESLCRFYVNRISCGAAHSMAITKTGNAFVWGNNKKGQLGYDPKVCKSLLTPTMVVLSLKQGENVEEVKQEVEENEMEIDQSEGQDANMQPQDDSKENLSIVKHAVCGTWSSIFVTETNKTLLHVWGGGDTIENSTIVIYDNVSHTNSIVSIKSRGENIIFLNDSGELCQYNINKKVVKKIDTLEKLHDLSLGSDYIGIVRSQNTLYMRGNNKYGQLGTGDKIDRNDEFQLVTTMEPTRVEKVA